MKNKQDIVLQPDSGSPFIELVVGPDRGRIYDLQQEHLSIGRGEDNDVIIHSGSVSRNHAQIDQNPDGAFVVREECHQ